MGCTVCKRYKCESSYFILKLTSAFPLCFLLYPQCQTVAKIASNVIVLYDFFDFLQIMFSFFAVASNIHGQGSPREGEFMFLKIALSNFKSCLVIIMNSPKGNSYCYCQFYYNPPQRSVAGDYIVFVLFLLLLLLFYSSEKLE